jgi:hypothetical protein
MGSLSTKILTSASSIPGPVVSELLRSSPEWRQLLCANKNLGARQWNDAWSVADTSSLRRDLVSRHLSRAQLTQALGHSKLATFLGALVLHNELTTYEVDAVADLAIDKPTRWELVNRSPMAARFHRMNIDKYSDYEKVICLARGGEIFTDDEIVAYLLQYSTLYATNTTQNGPIFYILEIIETRPAVFKALLQSQELPDAIQVAMAASQYLTKAVDQARIAKFNLDTDDGLHTRSKATVDARIALINNPRTSVRIVNTLVASEKERRPANLSTIRGDYSTLSGKELRSVIYMIRTTPSHSNDPLRLMFSPWALVELCANPNITELAHLRTLAVTLSAHVDHMSEDAYNQANETLRARNSGLETRPYPKGHAPSTNNIKIRPEASLAHLDERLHRSNLPSDIGKYLARHLGKNPRTWELFLSMADDPGAADSSLENFCALVKRLSTVAPMAR